MGFWLGQQTAQQLGNLTQQAGGPTAELMTDRSIDSHVYSIVRFKGGSVWQRKSIRQRCRSASRGRREDALYDGCVHAQGATDLQDSHAFCPELAYASFHGCFDRTAPEPDSPLFGARKAGVAEYWHIGAMTIRLSRRRSPMEMARTGGSSRFPPLSLFEFHSRWPVDAKNRRRVNSETSDRPGCRSHLHRNSRASRVSRAGEIARSAVPAVRPARDRNRHRDCGNGTT
jgi:hypothetical protein